MITSLETKELVDMIFRVGLQEGCTPQSALRDILTDLRHIAKENELDFGFAVEGSAEVFKEEENDD